MSGYTYDAAGNLTADGSHSYQWDAENHLKSIDNGTNGAFTYNAYGWRVYNTSGPVNHLYDPSGQPIGGNWANGAGWNAGIRFGSRLMAMYAGDGGHTAYFTHANALGSSSQTTDYAGNGGQAILFFPYGQKMSVSSNLYPNTYFQFYASIQLYDTANNGYVPPFRYYVPEQSHWLTPDPLAGDISNPQSLNRYAYVGNNPTSSIDPLGLRDCSKEPNPRACWIETYWGLGNSLQPTFGDLNDALAWLQTYSCAGGDCTYYFNFDAAFLGTLGGNTSREFLSGLKDKFLDFLAAHANYLPGVCTAGVFGFGTGGIGNDKGGGQGGVLTDKQIGQPATTQPIGEIGYGPVGVGQTPSETLVFVEPAPKVPVGVVYAANPKNFFINNSGISIGLFAGKAGNKKGLAGAFGGGAYLTFSSAANCLKNF